MSTAQAMLLVAVAGFFVHVLFPAESAVSWWARGVMVCAFLGFIGSGSGTLAWIGGVGLLLLIGMAFAGYPELRRGLRRIVRRPAHLAALAVALWGLVVGLHALGVPGFRLLSIPGASNLAPVSVQAALTSHHSLNKAFADAGSREDIDEVKGRIPVLLAIQYAIFRQDDTLIPGWAGVLRAAETPGQTLQDIAVFGRGGNTPTPPGEQGPACSTNLPHVAEWYGVYVDGDRALALTELANHCGAPWRSEIFLRRIDGQWLLDGDERWGDDEYSEA